MNDSIYDEWEKYPQSKLRLGDFNKSERLWVRVLPDHNLGIDNDPLWRRYRYQDIVTPIEGSPEILHRRWNSRFWFSYKITKGDIDRRKEIFNILSPHGYPSFVIDGLGHVLFKENSAEATGIVETLLGTLPYITDIESDDIKD